MDNQTILPRAYSTFYMTNSRLQIFQPAGGFHMQLRFHDLIHQPSGELNEDESALAQCMMAIAGFVRKMSGTSEVDTETMNRHVVKMVEEALRYLISSEGGTISFSLFPQLL